MIDEYHLITPEIFVPSKYFTVGRGKIKSQINHRVEAGLQPIFSESDKYWIQIARENNSCTYCDAVFTWSNRRSKDHFIPRSKGGKSIGNIVVCCKRCNNLKSDKEFNSIAAIRSYILYAIS